ncbi:MAG: nucleotidyltransferase domain-containing protein [Chloroflexi bacterium]|nr:nucleotidyltransferase domain-containing protein [Chloroflexota bacterium]
MTTEDAAPTTSATLQEAVQRLVVAAHPLKIILFGSQARGDTGPDSDLDLLVVLRTVPDKRAEMVRLREALRPLPIPIDVLVFALHDLEEWGDVRGTIVYPALREGIVLYEAA